MDITPSRRVFLAGFSHGRVSEGVHDRLYASILAIGSDERCLVLVSLDLIGLFKNFIDEIRRSVADSFGVKPWEVLFCCTHTHSGPDTIGLWGSDEYTSGVDDDYMEWLRSALSEAIIKALENTVRGYARYSWILVDPRGIVRNTRDRGLVDRYLSSFRFIDESGRTIATIVNFACHPEVLSDDNKLITADYVHYLRSCIEDNIGGITVFVNGPLGGMLTPDVKARSFDEAERVGVRLARYFMDCLEYEERVENAIIDLAYSELTLPVDNPLFLEASRRGLLRRSIIDGRILTEVCIARIGEISMVTIPGEALPRIGMELRGILDGRCKIVACLGNDEVGYIIPEDSWDPDRYEEGMSLGPSTASIIEGEVGRLVRRIRSTM